MTSVPAGPKYLAVREHLRRRVSALPEHTLLPPEPVLCAEYGVSRITLRRAVDGLVADGHLVREQGRGTYVTRPGDPARVPRELRAPDRRLHLGDDRAGRAGRRHRAHAADRAGAGAWVAAELGIEVATDVVELVRLRSVDGAPNHVAHSFLSAETYPQRRRPGLRPRARSTSSCARSTAADLAHARIVVDVGTAAPDEADLLRVVAGSPLLVVRTTVHDSDGRPLVHSFSRLRPDVSQVEFEVSVTGR